jgi:hypothetical protein
VAFRTHESTITITGGLPCEINLRANYEAGSVAIELINVRRLGTVEKRLDSGALKEALDTLGRYVLGIDAEFAA